MPSQVNADVDGSFAPIPIDPNRRHRYAVDGRPVYGGIAQDAGADGYNVQGTSAAEIDEKHYRDLAGQTNSAPYIDRTQTDESRALGLQARGVQLGSLGYLENGAAGTSDDQRALRAGAEGTSDDMFNLRQGALGTTADAQYLQSAAAGNAPSRAEALGQQMSDRALRAQVSAAGNVRGGPGASAAAFRATSQNAALQRADMNMGIQAGRADEMTGARNAYATAMAGGRRDYGTGMNNARRDFSVGSNTARGAYSAGAQDLRQGDTTMRQQDIGLATDQAKLVAGQRAEDSSNARFYNGLDNSTKFGVLAAQTGDTDAADRQRASIRAAEVAEDQKRWDRGKDAIALESSAISGGASGKMMTQGGGGTGGSGGSSSQMGTGYHDGVDHDDPYSDVKTKEPVTWGSLAPITMGGAPKAGDGQTIADQSASYRDTMTSDRSAKEAARMSGKAEGYMAGMRASMASGPTVKPPRPALPSTRDDVDSGAYAGYRGGLYHGNPYGEPDPRATEADDAMAGMQASLDAGPSVRPRDTMTSDTAAKEAAVEVAAFKRGHQYAQSKDRALLPDTMDNSDGEGAGPAAQDQTMGKASGSRSYGKRDPLERAAHVADYEVEKQRGISANPFAAGMSLPQAMAAKQKEKELARTSHGIRQMQSFDRTGPNTITDSSEVFGSPRPHALDPQTTRAQARLPAVNHQLARGLYVPGGADPPMSIGRDAGGVAPAPILSVEDQAKANTTLSDEKTKDQFGDVPDAKMADAMRSMEPHPYAYKSEYVGASGQKPGEVNIGPMANDMAKDPVASTAITREPDTGLLAIDKDKGLKMVMGSLASLQHQVDGIRTTEPSKGRYRGGSSHP